MNRPVIFPKNLKQSGQISKHVNSANFLSMIGYTVDSEMFART